MDERKKEIPLTLVADNSSAELELKRAQQELEFCQTRTTDSLRRLAANLLRIIAGAGEPGALMRDIDDIRIAYDEYLVP